MISIEQLSKRFRKLQALQQVSAVFEPGQVIALIGPNGSGKTTLIKCILGMVRPDKGRILVDGKPVSKEHQYRSQIGYMPQIGRYPDNMKVRQLFTMLEKIRSDKNTTLDKDLYEAFKLDAIAHKSMRTLSGGTRQKVSAALAFLFQPPILILDEPTAGLDPLAAEILKEKICAEKKKNKLVVITSHILSDLEEMTTHVMYMQDGNVQFFKPWEQLQQETGETRLGKAIAQIMRGGPLAVNWINRLLEKSTEEKIY